MQSLLLVNVGMELAISTVVIGSLYNKPDAEFVLTDSESSWFGKHRFDETVTGTGFASFFFFLWFRFLKKRKIPIPTD